MALKFNVVIRKLLVSYSRQQPYEEGNRKMDKSCILHGI